MKKCTRRIACILPVLLAVGAIGHAQEQQITNAEFTLRVTPGPQYEVSKTIFLFLTLPIYPQMACWLETADGRYVATVYATQGGARNNFAFAPKGGRPEVLPVWAHRASLQGSVPDAVSGATAKTAAEHTARLGTPLDPGRYVAFLEVNRSYDYNDSYTKESSGVNGQPSVIYRAELDLGTGSSRADFVAFGVGSVDGSSGDVRPGLAGITTALSIIDHAEIGFGGQ